MPGCIQFHHTCASERVSKGQPVLHMHVDNLCVRYTVIVRLPTPQMNERVCLSEGHPSYGPPMQFCELQRTTTIGY